MNRLLRRGFWKAIPTALAKFRSAGDAADSSFVPVHRSARWGKWWRGIKDIGPSQDGKTTKTHALTDVLGRLGVLLMTAVSASDVTTAPAELAEALGRIHHLSFDKGFGADWLRSDPHRIGIAPVIQATAGSAMTGPVVGSVGVLSDVQPPQTLSSHHHALRQAPPEPRLTIARAAVVTFRR